MTLTRTIASTLAALALGGTLIASAAPAQAGWKYHHHNRGGFVAAGVLGALAVGGAIAASGPYYGYGGGCYMARRSFVDRYGYVYERPVRVCG